MEERLVGLWSIMYTKKSESFAEALEITLKESLTKKVAKDILECPVCLNDINGDSIYQCSNGHLICFKCQDKLQSCPVCRIKLDKRPIRNLALEKLLGRLVSQNRAAKCDKRKEGYSTPDEAMACKFSSKGIRSKYIRIYCYRCNARFICDASLKIVNCPRPYCKEKISLECSMPPNSTDSPAIIISENTTIKTNCIQLNTLDISNIGTEKNCISQAQVSFSTAGTAKPSSVVLCILGFITIVTVGAVGLTSDTIILSVLVASFSYRNISHSNSIKQLASKFDVNKEDAARNEENCANNCTVLKNCNLVFHAMKMAESKNHCSAPLIFQSHATGGQGKSCRKKERKQSENCHRR